MKTYTSQNHPGKVFRRRQPGELALPEDCCNSKLNPEDVGWDRLGFSFVRGEEEEEGLWVYTEISEEEVEEQPASEKIQSLLESIDAMIDRNKELMQDAEKRAVSLLAMRDDLLKLRDGN